MNRKLILPWPVYAALPLVYLAGGIGALIFMAHPVAKLAGLALAGWGGVILAGRRKKVV